MLMLKMFNVCVRDSQTARLIIPSKRSLKWKEELVKTVVVLWKSVDVKKCQKKRWVNYGSFVTHLKMKK